MNAMNTRRETADSDRGATYAALAATAERSLCALEAEGRGLSLKERAGEVLTAEERARLSSLAARLREHRAAVLALRGRATSAQGRE